MSSNSVPQCTSTSIGGIVCCLIIVALCSFAANGTKGANGKTPGTGMFLWACAALYCLSTLSAVYSYMFPKPCSTQQPAQA